MVGLKDSPDIQTSHTSHLLESDHGGIERKMLYHRIYASEPSLESDHGGIESPVLRPLAVITASLESDHGGIES